MHSKNNWLLKRISSRWNGEAWRTHLEYRCCSLELTLSAWTDLKSVGGVRVCAYAVQYYVEVTYPRENIPLDCTDPYIPADSIYIYIYTQETGSSNEIDNRRNNVVSTWWERAFLSWTLFFRIVCLIKLNILTFKAEVCASYSFLSDRKSWRWKMPLKQTNH